ncbi:glioma tumor suppressor candidate region 1 protein-like, partial [Tropilaelaps mercedesae]
MEQAERDRVAKEKMALTAVKTETGSPPPPTPVAAISALTTTPVIPTVAKVLIKQDVSVSPQANGGFELIPSVAPVVLPTPTTPPVQRPPAPVAPTTAPTTALPAGKTKDVRDSKDKEARADGKEVKESAKDAGKESKDTKDGTKASAKVMTPAMTKAAKKRQAAKERERLAQEKFKRQRFEQRVANDQKEVLTPRLEPFKERQEAIKRLLSYHVADVAEPSVLALQECDAAFERLSARMLQAKEHLISRFQLASLKAGMSETPMNERLLVSQLLLDDEKQLQSERVEETLSLMEGPDPTEFFPMPSSHHNQPTAMETGSDRGGSAAMDPPSGGAGCDEPRPEMLLPDDLDEAEDHEVDEQAEREDDALLDQRGRADADADVDDGIDQASGLMRMDEVHGP